MLGSNKQKKDINTMKKRKLVQFVDKADQKTVQLFPRFLPNQKYVLMAVSLNPLRCRVNALDFMCCKQGSGGEERLIKTFR